MHVAFAGKLVSMQEAFVGGGGGAGHSRRGCRVSAAAQTKHQSNSLLYTVSGGAYSTPLLVYVCESAESMHFCQPPSLLRYV